MADITLQLSMTASTKLVVEADADSSGIRDFLAVDVDIVPKDYIAVPPDIAVYELVTGLFGCCKALRKDKDLNFCLYKFVVQTHELKKTVVSRARLVREVALCKLQAVDKELDFRNYVEHEPYSFWSNKAAALYMQARSVYGLTEMPLNNEFEHLVLMDVFISAYVMGRQEVRRNWYQTNC